jgi:hypothetical protein
LFKSAELTSVDSNSISELEPFISLCQEAADQEILSTAPFVTIKVVAPA